MLKPLNLSQDNSSRNWAKDGSPTDRLCHYHAIAVANDTIAAVNSHEVAGTAAPE